MSLSAIRGKIKTKLEAITDVKNVYDYKRYCNDWATYQDLFIKDEKVNTWEIERLNFSANGHGASGEVEDKTHNFIIRGFYSIFDSLATEKTFQDLVEAIVSSFVKDPTLGGTANQVHYPISGEITKGKLGSVLCHIVEIHISITDRII
jgi:predicted phosphohydrolase